MKSISRILVIQTAYLGDVVLSLPMIQTIKNHLTEAEIDYLCIPATSGVLKNNPNIRDVIIYDKKDSDQIDKFIEVLSQIRERNYDVVISPHRSARSALLSYYSEARIRIGFDRNSLSFLYTDKVNYKVNQHEIVRNNNLAELLLGKYAGISNIQSHQKAEIFPSDTDRDYVQGILQHKNFIVLAPCSKWFTKQLTPEKSAELISKLQQEGFNVVLIGSEDDVSYSGELEKITDNRFLNLSGKLSPLQAYYTISISEALITVDSASQHLGAAAGVPIILIYGSTDRSFGFYPLTGEYRICEVQLECRPCTDHGRMSCPEKHFRCVNEISADYIIKLLREIKINK
ncbi:MAG: glycosyltransferase family 9 protein [Ignavibacteria bacterium]|nr:glycosyltransferase family 9 protein [Ignavibacteria bacterium]